MLINKCNSPVASLEAYLLDTNKVSVTIKKLGFHFFKSNVNLYTSENKFIKFLEKIEKELKNPSIPKKAVVAQLNSTNNEIILRVIKSNSNTFDVRMYYSFKRPFGCEDLISLTTVDLGNFINIK